MTRRRFSEKETIETLAWQGVVAPCYRCKEPLCKRVDLGIIWPKGNAIEREHLTEIAIGGKDEPDNCAYSHKDCHAVITNGTPATSAGSSKHRIAKTRGTRSAKFAVNKLALDKERPERSRFGWRRKV